MPKRFRHLHLATLALLSLLAASAASAQARLEARMLIATEVLQEQQRTPDQMIPQYLLQRAYGIAVFPGVDKVAFGLGGRHGSGVLSVRDSTGRFSSPVFVNITGGGVGWQAGYQKSDVVLVFTTRQGVERFNHGTVTLGGNASVAAGPVGRAGEAAVGSNAEVFSWSRNKGLFAGVSLDGTVLSVNGRENRSFYRIDDVTPEEIINGEVHRNDSDSVRSFLNTLATATGDVAPNSRPAPSPAPPPVQTHPAPPPAGDGSVVTFPLEDRSPGAEPVR